MVLYEIRIYTGTMLGAETESNVFINLIGTRGDSGKRRLHQSKNNEIKFQRGQVTETGFHLFLLTILPLIYLTKRHANRKYLRCSVDSCEEFREVWSFLSLHVIVLELSRGWDLTQQTKYSTSR